MGRNRRTCAVAIAIVACTVAACEDAPTTFIDAARVDAGDDATVDARPGPVTLFATTNNIATGLDLSWANPADADLAGVLLVAGAGVPVSFAPVDGTTYPVGMVVGTGQAVIHASLAQALAGFPGIAGVGFQFSAWAYDAAGQYSVVATTTGRTDLLGAQDGIIQLFQDGTVLVTQQPHNLRLSGTVAYDRIANTMTAQLTVENQTGRVLFNLKGLVDSASQGTVTNPAFPAADGLPMAYYGPEGVAVGATPARALTLTGIDGKEDPVVLTMHFVDAPALLVASGGSISAVDSAGSGQLGTVDFPDQPCAFNDPRGAALTADARRLFTGSKSVPRVAQLDLTTLTMTTSAMLATTDGVGAVSDVVLSADGAHLYAVLHDGAHARGGAGTGTSCTGGGQLAVARAPRLPGAGTGGNGGPIGTVYVVELDATTLAEVRRLDLQTAGRFGTIALLAGGRAVVTLSFGGAHVIDLAGWAEIDMDPGTAGVQSLDLGGTAHEEIAVSADGQSFAIAVTGTDGFHVDTFDTATLVETSATVTDLDFDKVVGMHRTADGQLAVLYRAGGGGKGGGSGGKLVTFDGATQTTTVPDDLARVDELVVAPDGQRYVVTTNTPAARVFATVTHTELDTDGDASNGITPLTLDSPARHHGVALFTPF